MSVPPECYTPTIDDVKALRAQYMKLISGQMARVIVDQNGERVEFTAANQAALLRYLRSLEAALGCGSAGPFDRPMGFTF